MIAVAFRMYDLDGDGMITKHELLTVLMMIVGKQISKDQLVSIVERTMVEADKDKNDCITFDEYFKIFENSDTEVKMSLRY